LSENVFFDTNSVANTEVPNKIEDTQMHDASDHIHAPEDCPTPARHPDEPNTEPEELGLPALEVTSTCEVSRTRILEGEGYLSAIIFTKSITGGLRTPKREKREGSPVSKLPVLNSTACEELDAPEQHQSKNLPEKSMPIQHAQVCFSFNSFSKPLLIA
jgi:hypothetical protein